MVNFHYPEDFEINNIEFETKYVGEEKNLIVTVDNVFKDCDKVLEKLKEYPIIKNYHKFDNLYPGYVTYLTLPNRNLDRILTYAINQHFFSGEPSEIQTRLNVLDNKEKVMERALIPHTDIVSYAGQMYLMDYPDSYTAFYKYKENGCESRRHDWRYKKYQRDIIDLYNSKEDGSTGKEHLNNPNYVDFDSIDEDEHWECYHKEPVVKNRLIIHPGNLWHSAYVKSKYDYEDYRYSIALFASLD